MAAKQAEAVAEKVEEAKTKREKSPISSDEDELISASKKKHRGASTEAEAFSSTEEKSSSSDEDELDKRLQLSQKKNRLVQEVDTLERVTTKLGETKNKSKIRLPELRAERNKWPSDLPI